MASEKTIVRKAKQEIKGMTGCIQCGQCCGPIIVTAYEFRAIKNYLMTNKLLDVLRFSSDLRKKIENEFDVPISCCYLLKQLTNGKTECLAYPVRPIVCRLQGIKKELPCPHAENPEIELGAWTSRYYDLVRITGHSLNSELDGILKEGDD